MRTSCSKSLRRWTSPSVSYCRFLLSTEVAIDESNTKEYLKHEYNRDGESYRSPWSNQYFPPSPDASFYPSADLLRMEQKANGLWAQYVHLYYDYAFSSVYLMDTDGKGFNGCFLVKKELNNQKEVKESCWDAIHVVTCEVAGNKVNYTVISTVLISLSAATDAIGKLSIAGSCNKTSKSEVTVSDEFSKDPDQFHLRQIGKIIEANENILRQEVADHYTSKQR